MGSVAFCQGEIEDMLRFGCSLTSCPGQLYLLIYDCYHCILYGTEEHWTVSMLINLYYNCFTSHLLYQICSFLCDTPFQTLDFPPKHWKHFITLYWPEKFCPNYIYVDGECCRSSIKFCETIEPDCNFKVTLSIHNL